MRTAAPWWTRLGVIAMLTVAVLAQTLGLLHRSVHNDTHHGHVNSQNAMQSNDRHDHGHHDHHDHHLDHGNQATSSWAERLFAGHGDGATCALYDAQTTVYQGFMPVVQVSIAQSAIHLIAFSQITSAARAAALFEARGPPAAL